MTLSSSEWHNRFTQQAQWTYDLRHHLYARLNLKHSDRILDVGCGTGVITSELNSLSEGHIFGLDILKAHLTLAQKYASQAAFTLGDAHHIPYETGNFDITVCHFLLLWVSNPIKVVSEMARVTQPGGSVLVLAEPDYGGRIDYPDEFSILGEWQQESLRRQGANPQIGRRLAEIFQQCGLRDHEIGVLGGQWSGSTILDEWESEWAILEYDMEQMNKTSKSASRLKDIDLSARERGERVLFVPTFYAMGRVPNLQD